MIRYFIFVLVSALTLSVHVHGQGLNSFKELGQYMRQEKQDKKNLKQAKIEITEQYKGKALYFISGKRLFVAPAAKEYTTSGYVDLYAISGDRLFGISDTLVVKRIDELQNKMYVCVDVSLVKEADRYGKPDAVALQLLKDNSTLPILVYPDPGWGVRGFDGVEASITLHTPLGDIVTTYPTSMVSDDDLDTLAHQLQIEYSSRLRIKREIDARHERERLAAEERRAREEQQRIKEEQAERERERAVVQAEEQKQRIILNNLKKKYGEEMGTLVYNHQICVGMSKDACIESIGQPIKISSFEKETSFEYKNRVVVISTQTGKIINIINY